MAAYCFDEHQLTQSRQYTLAPCALIGSLGHSQMHELTEPSILGRAGTHDQGLRKSCKERVERTHIAAEKPADETEPVLSALLSGDAIGPLDRGPNALQIESGTRCHFRIAGHHMRISARKDNDVSDGEPNRLAFCGDRPAAAFGN